MKARIRVVDVPITATAEEVERLLNAPYEEGYYTYSQAHLNLPEGVTMRAFYKLRVQPEKFQENH
jgi:hypothetical protein